MLWEGVRFTHFGDVIMAPIVPKASYFWVLNLFPTLCSTHRTPNTPQPIKLNNINSIPRQVFRFWAINTFDIIQAALHI